jgi:hypothetical protein
LLRVSADSWSMNSVPIVVTVKVTQREDGTWTALTKRLGLPKPVRSCASRFHRAEERPPPCGRGASVIDPTERSSACDPVVTSTRSSEATATDVAVRQIRHRRYAPSSASSLLSL